MTPLAIVQFQRRGAFLDRGGVINCRRERDSSIQQMRTAEAKAADLGTRVSELQQRLERER
jgi:hypothetical protein